MDKQTSEGRELSSLADNDEKSLFLLEKIYDKLGSIRTIQNDSRAQIEELKKLSKLQTECMVFLAQINNKGHTSSSDYDKYLSKRLSSMFYNNYPWKFNG